MYSAKSIPSTPTEEIVASLEALSVDGESIFCEGRNAMTLKYDASVKASNAARASQKKEYTAGLYEYTRALLADCRQEHDDRRTAAIVAREDEAKELSKLVFRPVLGTVETTSSTETSSSISNIEPDFTRRESR